MNTAIVLAAGKGSRMNSKTKKQFMELMGKPIVCYALDTFEKSECIHEIILVTGSEEIEYCKKEIVEKYAYKKVRKVVEGGKERYDSVYQGILAAENCEYIFVHDGARAFITEEEIERMWEEVQKHPACIAAVKSKDTVRISDEEGQVIATPNRDNVWIVQTPQVFLYDLVKKAYDAMYKAPTEGITDDAMIVERYSDYKIKIVETNYENIKITTPEDLTVGENILKARKIRLFEEIKK